MAEHAPASDPLKISNKILATISPAAARVLLVPVAPLSSTSLHVVTASPAWQLRAAGPSSSQLSSEEPLFNTACRPKLIIC